MTPGRSGTDRRTPLFRLVTYLLDRRRRILGLLSLSYLATLGGLAVTFATGTFDPTSRLGVVGVALLSLAFACFLLASVAVLAASSG